MKLEKASFAAGCFWGVQAAFDKIKGVIKTVVGYTEGDFKNPSYKKVCSGKTGHAEAILIEFNPEIVSYEKLLEIFWKIHDPTTINRQGPDVGSQYRSAIFYFNDKQRIKALNSRDKEAKKYKNKIVTQIVKTKEFYPAEDYHQKYYLTHTVVCHI
ncbi:MAG: peptide-methionine (S)-S-oxide reductase MsrA [Nanoarchaeota archaeon]